MIAPQCSVICGSPGQQAQAAEAAGAGCCPVRCAQVTTVGDGLTTVPEFDLDIADGQLAEVTLTGYVTRTDVNVNGLQEGFVFLRGIARRNDADNVFPGLAVLAQDTSLQWTAVGGLGSLPLGTATALNVDGNTLQVLLDGAAGTWFWDLEYHYCIRDQLVDVEGGG